MPAAQRYLAAAVQTIERIATEEAPHICAVGDAIADAIARGGRLFASGCGHSALAVQEIVYRAGGLMLVNPLLAPGLDGITTRPATMGSTLEKLPGLGTVTVESSPVRAGDVLIVVSVSGVNAVPVETARAGRARGAVVVAVTSCAYVDVPAPVERLADIAHHVIDTKVPIGDAVLSSPGVPQPFGPISGIAASAALQALVAAIIDGMLARDLTPPVFQSANLDGGAEWNARHLAEHRDRIFYL